MNLNVRPQKVLVRYCCMNVVEEEGIACVVCW